MKRTPFTIHNLKSPWFWLIIFMVILLLLLGVGKWRSTSTGPQVQVPMFYDAHYLYPRPWTQAQEAPGVPAPFPVAFYGENRITQPFVSGADNLAMVEVWLQGSPYGSVTATLADETGALYTGRVSSPENPRGGYVRFAFPTIAKAAGRTFWLTLAAPDAPVEEPAITHTIGGDRLGGAVQVNEYRHPGNLELRTYVKGTAVFAALAEQLLPDLFRLRLQQFKPIKGETFAVLLLLMVGLSVIYLVLARPSGQNLMSAVGWTVVGLLGGLLIWQLGWRRVQLPLLDRAVMMEAAGETAVSPAGDDFRMIDDLALRLWTAERQPEERFIDTAVVGDFPAIVVPAESELGYALDVGQNGRLRVGAQVKEPGQLQYTLFFNDTELASQLVDTERVWFDVDLTPFAGQGGRLRLVTEAVSGQPVGYWLQPQILAQTDWLLTELPETAQPAGHRFGEDVVLVGVDVEMAEGNQVDVVLYWQAERPLAQNGTVFVHLLDADGNLIAQHDGQPVQNSYPLSIWPTGVLIADRHTLILPHPLPAAPAQLSIGLYNPADFSRWLVTNPDGTPAPEASARLPLERTP